MPLKKEIKNKLSFITKDAEGNPVTLCVKKPNAEISRKLQLVYNSSYRELVEGGTIVKAKIRDVAKQQNIWNDEKEKLVNDLNKELNENELKLKRGGAAGLTKKKGKEIALRMAEIRVQIQELVSSFNDLDSNTAESQSELLRFNHMVALCTYNENGDNYFADYNDFLERVNSGEQATFDASRHMALLAHGLDPNYEANLIENKFLKDYGFVNEKLRFIDKDGNLVDSKGKRIREDGRYINDKGELIDANGNLVDEEGNYVVEFKPFLDDEEDTQDSVSVKKK